MNVVAGAEVKSAVRTDSDAGSHNRLHGMDNIRAVAMVLGVMYHATASFIPVNGHPMLVTDVDKSFCLSIFALFIHSFRLQVFFFLAGFFARYSLIRHGEVGFLRARVKRLVFPLVLGWLLFVPVLVPISLYAKMLAHISVGHVHPYLPRFPQFPLAHLWFLYVLLEFVVITALLRKGLALVDRKGILGSAFLAVAERVVSPLGIVALAVPTAFMFFFKADWSIGFGIRPPNTSFVTSLDAWLAYGLSYCLGEAAAIQRAFFARLNQHLETLAVIAIASFVGCIWVGQRTTFFQPISSEAHRLAAVSLYSFASWGFTFVIIGMVLRVLPTFSRLCRFLARASLWVYLSHLPLVLFLQAVVSQLPVPSIFKYLWIVSCTFVILLTIYAGFQKAIRSINWLNFSWTG